MNNLHIYTTVHQPATRFIVLAGTKARWMRYRRRHVFTCSVCGRRRWASKLTVQVYYDDVRFCCRDRHR